jgi:hypothetical protein
MITGNDNLLGATGVLDVGVRPGVDDEEEPLLDNLRSEELRNELNELDVSTADDSPESVYNEVINSL